MRRPGLHIAGRAALALLLLLSLPSCSIRKFRAAREALTFAADSLESQPGRALELLGGIDRRALWTRQMKAEYGLFLAEALDKNAIDTAGPSLIMPAVDYYSLRGPEDRQMLAQYYLGCAYRNVGDLAKTIVPYSNALRLAQKCHADRYRGLAALGLASCYENEYNPQAALQYIEEACNGFELCRDSSSLALSLYHKAVALSNIKRWDEADSVFLQIFSMDTCITSSILPHVACAYAKSLAIGPSRDFAKAVSIFESCISETGGLVSYDFWCCYAMSLHFSGCRW